MCERNGLVLLYLPPHSSHILQILNGFMSTAVPTNIVKSFKNSGISIRGEGQHVFGHVTAETVRLYPAVEGMNAFGREAAEQAGIESTNLELGGFVISCAAVASGEQGEHA
jgi:hypothetical protein